MSFFKKIHQILQKITSNCFRSYRTQGVQYDDRAQGVILAPATLQRGLYMVPPFLFLLRGGDHNKETL
jgi:hypothetical protein